MPLKHTTETFLIVLLGGLCVLTGLLVATLPAFPSGIVPWSILAVLSVIYPLSLGATFKKSRADKVFRVMHYIPFGILLLWLLLQMLTHFVPAVAPVFAVSVWGWSLAPVLIGFAVVAWYTARILRKRGMRLAILALILLPFLVGGIESEAHSRSDAQLASILWQGDWWKVFSGDSALPARMVASTVSTGVEAETVMTPEQKSEKEWQKKLAKVESMSQQIESKREYRRRLEFLRSGLTSDPLSGTGEELRLALSNPDALPHSGFGWGGVAVSLLAGYCCTLHSRQLARG